MTFTELTSRMEQRGFDKYVLGPFLIFVGVYYSTLPKKIRRVLVGAGTFQIMYNWKEYSELEHRVSESVKQSRQEIV